MKLLKWIKSRISKFYHKIELSISLFYYFYQRYDNSRKKVFIDSLVHKFFKIYLGEDILSLELDHKIYNFIVVDQIINFINDSQFFEISVYFNFDDDKEMFLLQNLNECISYYKLKNTLKFFYEIWDNNLLKLQKEILMEKQEKIWTNLILDNRATTDYILNQETEHKLNIVSDCLSRYTQECPHSNFSKYGYSYKLL